MNTTETTTGPFYKRVAERHARLSNDRQRLLDMGNNGPRDMAERAAKIEHLDGRLAELEWTYEQATGNSMATTPRAATCARCNKPIVWDAGDLAWSDAGSYNLICVQGSDEDGSDALGHVAEKV